MLVNGRSASASEIVAGAFKLMDRALLIGTQTYGKGVVQMAPTIRRGDAQHKVSFKLTVAQYLLEDGYSVHQEEGIEPHVVLSPIYTSESGFVAISTDEAELQYLNRDDTDLPLIIAKETLRRLPSKRASTSQLAQLQAASKRVISELRAAEMAELDQRRARGETVRPADELAARQRGQLAALTEVVDSIELFSTQAVHGGLWRSPYKADSRMGLNHQMSSLSCAMNVNAPVSAQPRASSESDTRADAACARLFRGQGSTVNGGRHSSTSATTKSCHFGRKLLPARARATPCASSTTRSRCAPSARRSARGWMRGTSCLRTG